MRAHSQRVRAECVCCRGQTVLLVMGPAVWEVSVICHRCNVGKCGTVTSIECGCRGSIDQHLQEHGCKSREGRLILRYQGRR